MRTSAAEKAVAALTAKIDALIAARDAVEAAFAVEERADTPKRSRKRKGLPNGAAEPKE